MEKKLFSSEKKMSRREASERIQKIAERLGEGKIELSSGQDSISLEPADQVELEIEVEEESDGKSIEIEVEWSENSSEDIEIK